MKLLPTDRFIANDAIDSIHRFLNIHGEGAVGVMVGLIGGSAFAVRGVVGLL